MLYLKQSHSGKSFTITLFLTLVICLIVIAYYLIVVVKREHAQPYKEGIQMAPAAATRVPQIPKGARGTKVQEKTVLSGTPKDLSGVFERYPKEDVGDDARKSWARFLPEDKAKLSNGIDKKVSECQDALNIDQNDTHAKSALKVSRMLKKLIDNEFNIELKKKQTSGEKKE